MKISKGYIKIGLKRTSKVMNEEGSVLSMKVELLMTKLIFSQLTYWRKSLEPLAQFQGSYIVKEIRTQVDTLLCYPGLKTKDQD